MRIKTFQEIKNRIKTITRSNASTRNKLIANGLYSDYKYLYSEYHKLKTTILDAEKELDIAMENYK